MRQGTLLVSPATAGSGTSLRFTGSLATKLGLYQVSVCELAQFLENNLGKNSRSRPRLTIM
jgi:hypothetical protein